MSRPLGRFLLKGKQYNSIGKSRTANTLIKTLAIWFGASVGPQVKWRSFYMYLNYTRTFSHRTRIMYLKDEIFLLFLHILIEKISIVAKKQNKEKHHSVQIHMQNGKCLPLCSFTSAAINTRMVGKLLPYPRFETSARHKVHCFQEWKK